MENNLQIHSVYEGLVVKYTDKGEKVVDGRSLHEFLEVKTKFSDWIKRQIEEYEFEENVDFTHFSDLRNPMDKTIDYILKLDMAKELCMVSKTEQGRKMRKYFIEIERRYMEDRQKEDLKFKLEILRENVYVLPEPTKKFLEGEIHSLVVGGHHVRDKVDKMLSEHKVLTVTKDENTGFIVIEGKE